MKNIFLALFCFGFSVAVVTDQDVAQDQTVTVISNGVEEKVTLPVDESEQNQIKNKRPKPKPKEAEEKSRLQIYAEEDKLTIKIPKVDLDKKADDRDPPPAPKHGAKPGPISFFSKRVQKK